MTRCKAKEKNKEKYFARVFSVVNFSLSVELNEFWLLPAESPWPATFVNYFLAIDSFVLTSAQTC